ncbi:MAG TPA: type II toxin-antitoxin system ParD family antitoxin [Telluria sp.]|jgi:antitoxin ParD1/3/4
MGTVNKIIALTDQEGTWVQAQIDNGRFANESEYIRELIRSDQEGQDQIENLRDALIEGENSGEPETFDAVAFKQKMKQKYG